MKAVTFALPFVFIVVAPSLSYAACKESILMESGWVFKFANAKATLYNPQGAMYTDVSLEDLQVVGRDVIGVLTGTPDRQRVAAWASCFRESGSESTDIIDSVTPQVQGCPRYLRRSLIAWRQVGNSDLKTWEVLNVSRMTLKVTYREDGVNSSPDTLPPGHFVRVKLNGSQIPPYVVRDFNELMSFNRTNGANGKTLRCDLSIVPN
jgi:hypothetical protein